MKSPLALSFPYSTSSCAASNSRLCILLGFLKCPYRHRRFRTRQDPTGNRPRQAHRFDLRALHGRQFHRHSYRHYPRRLHRGPARPGHHRQGRHLLRHRHQPVRRTGLQGQGTRSHRRHPYLLPRRGVDQTVLPHGRRGPRTRHGPAAKGFRHQQHMDGIRHAQLPSRYAVYLHVRGAGHADPPFQGRSAGPARHLTRPSIRNSAR